MKREISANELHILLEAITSSEVVESRVQLITELGDLDVTEGSRLATLLQSLTIFWEDFTCLDVSQCMLNKAILNVASKYVDSDLSQCLSHFLVLGTKASIWCQKHLKMTLMSTEDSQEEEHSSIFFQLLLDFLRFSASGFSILARYPVSSSKELMVITEKFVLELLNLTKDSISEIKRINSCGSELLKLAQSVLDASIQLCKVYCSGIKWDLFDSNTPNGEEAKVGNHAVNITKCTIEKLSELGVFAANDGGSLVSVLNLSWKGVVTLLQLGEGTLGVKMNALDVILTLISLANKSLKCVAETWSSSPKEKVSVAESKRIFLPVKFYLINAVRIISQYPSQAFLRYKDITICTLMISSFRMSLSREEKLSSASEALTELLEPTSFHLLNSLLNSAQVKPDQKFEILNWLFSDINYDFAPGSDSMGEIFSVKCDSMHGARILLLGRLALFLNLLKSATDLEEELRVGIATKLKWVLEIIVEEDVYSSVLDLEVPILYNSGQSKNKTQELSYQPMFASILTALKTFMIVVSSSTQAWEETFTFLLENFLHPHFLCQEIVMELLSFMVRYGDTELVNEIIDKLCLLLRFVGSTESVFNGSVLRKIARSICVLLTYGSQSLVDRVYDSLIVSTRSNKSSSSVHIALLMEEFPLHLLSDKVKTTATQRIVAEYFGFLEEFDDVSLKVSGSSVYGSPLFALSAALHSLQVNVSDTDMKTLKLLVSMIRKYKKSTENSAKDHYRKLISETLGIISNMKHLYASDEMETVLLELKNLFISGPTVPDTQLFQCKPNLALFMAGLGHIELTESDNSAKSSAIWELYHMLLKERHWALVHLAISAFGYFAARTSCNQLWRFVPQDAALSFDLESGSEANEDRFMNELKGFLEKEIGRIIMPESCWLLKEGLKLKEKVKKIASFEQDFVVCEKMEVDTEKEKQGNKKRKLPDGISKGVELLQSGMKVIGDGISLLEQNQMDCVELHDSFLTQFSRLEDVISHLANLAGSGQV